MSKDFELKCFLKNNNFDRQGKIAKDFFILKHAPAPANFNFCESASARALAQTEYLLKNCFLKATKLFCILVLYFGLSKSSDISLHNQLISGVFMATNPS